LEEWLARSKITPERVLEFGSYHAIVACVAAGSGIALVPHSVVHALHAEHEVSILPLPSEFTEATTFLVWPREHRSVALDALRRGCRISNPDSLWTNCARVGFNEAGKQYSENETKRLWQQAPRLISAGLGSASRAPKRKPTLTFFSSKCFQIMPFADGLRIA